MNRILFDTLTFLNGMIAIIAIAGAAYAGSLIPAFSSARPVGVIIGAGAGIVVAAIFCGLIAYMALTEKHLRQIAMGQRPHGEQSHKEASPARQEPTL